MKRYLIIPLILLFVLLSSILFADLTSIEKEFEKNFDSLTLYKESIGADATSTEYYFYWSKDGKIKKYRFMITGSYDGVRILEDLYFVNDGELALFTYWSGKIKDLKQLKRGLGPKFISKGKCLFTNEKMTQWYENGKLRTEVPKKEWDEQEQEIKRIKKFAIWGWRDILRKKKGSD